MSVILRYARNFKHYSVLKKYVQLNPILNRQVNCNRVLSHTPLRCQVTLAAQSTLPKDNRLDKSLRRLDEDVRRSGRISRKEFEEILEDLQFARYATSSQSLLIIRCCGNLIPEEAPEVRTVLANELWRTLENMGVQMDVSHYNALLRVYLENEHTFSPTEFLSNMEAKGIEPNRVTYQRLIARYCQLGDVEGATRILEFMREKNLPVNESVFNALIMGHSHANDMESANGILAVMQQAGMEPSTETYKTLICGYAKCGDLNKVRSLLDDCDSKQMSFMDRDYMDIIYELAVNNHTAIIDEIIGKMKQNPGYNQEAINLILRLITKGKDDVAKKVFFTMPRSLKPDGTAVPAGNFMLKQMVRMNRPVEEIEQFCLSLEEKNLNSGALIQAAEFSLQFGLVDLSCSLLATLKKDGFPIRVHYFWPLLAHHGQKKDTTGLIEVIRRMESQFGLTPNGETLKDYVVPFFSHLSPPEIIQSLKSIGLTNAAAAFAVVVQLLHENKLADAVKIASENIAYYSPILIRRHLLGAFLFTKDVKSYVSMLHLVRDGLHRMSDVRQDDESADSNIPDGAEITGQFLIDLVTSPVRDKGETFHKILEGLVEHGLSISNIVAEQIADKLSEEKKMAEISTLLATLTAGNLTPLPVKRQQQSSAPVVTDKLLKAKIASLERRGEPTHLVKMQLLGLYCRNKDLIEAEELMKDMEAENLPFTGATYAQLIDLYCHHEKLDEALSCLKKLQERERDYILAGLKIVKLATLLVKNGQLDECLKFLQEYPHEIKKTDQSFVYNSTCWKMLNTLAELGQPQSVKQLLDTLVEKKYIEVNNVLLGPLIKAYLLKDDLDGALNAFEMCVKEHSCTPWKNEIAVRLIQADNPEQLQKLTDLSTAVHGESNSLYDLVFAFVECGRIRAARKILETPGLHRSSQRLISACQRYRQDGRISNLEGLIEATLDHPYINRSAIFYELLLSYCKIDDVDKAFGLWTKMQEEDVHPSDDFLFTLGSLLKKHGKKVPFTIPELSYVTEEKPPTVSDNLKALKSAINNDDLDRALDIKRRSSDFMKSNLTISSLSNLLEKLSKAGRQSEALKLVFELLEQNLYPKPEALRSFLNQLAIAGDIENISKIGSYLNQDIKKKVSYDNRLCNAYATSGQANVYIQNLDKLIENSANDDLTAIAESFPRGGALGLLETGPDNIESYEIVARKYAARGINSPINILWVHKFINGQKEAADKLWSEFLSKDDRIMYTPILTKARTDQDAALLQNLLSKLEAIPVPRERLGHVYSILLHIQMDQNGHSEALSTLEKALRVINLEDLTPKVMERLKAAVTAEGKTFPYEVPVKTSSNSSSSSDEEDGVKK